MGKGRVRKIIQISCWSVFGLLSTVTLIESCIPSSASGFRSRSLSQIIADIINSIAPSKPALEVAPESLTLTPTVSKATLDNGETANLFDENEAIVGTTKMFTYKLTYQTEPKPDLYDSSIDLKFIKTPGEGSFTHTLTTGKDGGALRIIPTKEGEYEFTLTDAAKHVATFSFTAKQRIAPKEIKTNVESLSVKKGQVTRLPFAMSLGNLKRDDGSVDHYLARYYDRSKAVFTSSAPAVFSVSGGGLIKGLSDGEGDLLYEGKRVCHVFVAGTFESKVASINVSSAITTISPLDYDYSYGHLLTVTCFDSLGKEVEPEEPLLFSSSDPLVAKVDDDHLEEVDGALTSVKGGFVSGYRNLGEASVTVALASNPTIKASHNFTSTKVDPTSVTVKAQSGNTEILATGSSIQAGNAITLTSSFEPKNASNTALHVTVSDISIAQVLNNDTNNPSISLLKDGSLTFKVSSVALGEDTGSVFVVTVTARPQIPEGDMSDFHAVFRKAIGHFALFLVTGLFGAIAMFMTFWRDKKWRVPALLGVLLLSGFVLAGFSEALQAIPVLQRSPQWSDVLIDWLGFAASSAAIALIYLTVQLIRLAKKRPPKDEAPKS